MTAFFAAFARWMVKRAGQLVSLPLAGWYAITRRIDLQILWPACKNVALERRCTMGWSYLDALNHAKAAFAVHAFGDAGWLWLGDEEVKRRIDRLSW